MSKLSGDTLREGINTLLEGSKSKPRKFTETIELQARHPAQRDTSRWHLN